MDTATFEELQTFGKDCAEAVKSLPPEIAMILMSIIVEFQKIIQFEQTVEQHRNDKDALRRKLVKLNCHSLQHTKDMLIAATLNN